MAFSGCDIMEKWNLMPSLELCELKIQGPLAYLNIKREEVYNALNTQLISELIAALNWTSEHSAAKKEKIFDKYGKEYLRVLVLTSNGKHFCSGADINMMRDAGSKSVEENRIDSIRLDNLFNSLWAHPCFTIGYIQGVALGGGAGLVACLDHVIADSNTKIALSEAKLGILPAVIGPYVYRKIGSAQFRRLSMLASKIDAEEAQRIGFINEIIEFQGSFESSSERVISDVLTTGPIAVYMAKKLTLSFDRWEKTDDELRQWTLDKTSQMRGSREGQEGLSSFLERRLPDWSIQKKEN